MDKYELSKHDFDRVNLGLTLLMNELLRDTDTLAEASRVGSLRERFAKAHTGWLETES